MRTLESRSKVASSRTVEPDWEGAARAHAELLGAVAPANTTLHVAGLIGEGFLVEVEVEAELSSSQT